jgi:hypothetical protein
MSEQVLEHIERIARLLATPTFGEKRRRRQLNEKFEILKKIHERNTKLFGARHQDQGTDHEHSK